MDDRVRAEETTFYLRKEQRWERDPSHRFGYWNGHWVWVVYGSWNTITERPLIVLQVYRCKEHKWQKEGYKTVRGVQQRFPQDFTESCQEAPDFRPEQLTEGNSYVKDGEYGDWVPIYRWVVLPPFPKEEPLW